MTKKLRHDGSSPSESILLTSQTTTFLPKAVVLSRKQRSELNKLLVEYKRKVHYKDVPLKDQDHRKPKWKPAKMSQEQRKEWSARQLENGYAMSDTPMWLNQINKEWFPFQNRRVHSIDGEGMTLENGEHIYTLLAAHHEGTNTCISVDMPKNSKHGLSTKACFDFLLDLDPDTIKVGFAVTYDVNMMLKDIPKKFLQELNDHAEVCWDKYKIGWVPGKFFRLSHYCEEDFQFNPSRKPDASVHLWDVFPFFQCSFVKALKEWKIGDSETVLAIEQMKAERSNFNNEDPEDVKRYCYQEVTLLSELTRKLLDMCKRVDIRIKRLDGAGAVASAILESYEVKRYLEPIVNGRRTLPFEVYESALQAYYGGRFDIRAVGYFPGTTYEYDIRSAYPNEMQKLPCLACGRWERSSQYDPDHSIGIWHVKWNIGACTQVDSTGEPDPNGQPGYRDATEDSGPYECNLSWPPFPFRAKNGGIYYPANGEGWYYTVEVNSARRLHPRASIDVLEGWIFNRPEDCIQHHHPFRFIPHLYAERNRLKASGDFSQIILKLGLNAMYGKTAQSVGWGDKNPPHQSFIWAGLITAGTRAKILDAIAQDPDAVISVATDAVISTKSLDLTCSEELGDWEAFEIHDLMLIQSGFSTYIRDDERKWKNRGFSSKGIDLDKIESAWYSNGVLELSDIRFIGLQTALLRKDWSVWRKWLSVPKKIDMFNAAGRMFMPNDSVGWGLVGLDKPEAIRQARNGKSVPLLPWIQGWSPVLVETGGVSVAYKPKSNWTDAYTMKEDVVLEQEQP